MLKFLDSETSRWFQTNSFIKKILTSGWFIFPRQRHPKLISYVFFNVDSNRSIHCLFHRSFLVFFWEFKVSINFDSTFLGHFRSSFFPGTMYLFWIVVYKGGDQGAGGWGGCWPLCINIGSFVSGQHPML